MPRQKPAALRHADSFLSLVMMRRKRAPEQNRNDQREDDDFLESAGPERGKRFEETHQNGSRCRQRVARKAADDRADEPLQADEKPGVVVDGRDRSDEHPRERPEQCGKHEGQAAGKTRADSDQSSADAIERGGAQGLPVQRSPEEKIKRSDQDQRRKEHESALAADGDIAHVKSGIGERRRAGALGAEEPQSQPQHHKMNSDGNDEQNQHRCLGQRLVCDPIKQRAQRGDDDKRQHDLNRKRKRQRCGGVDHTGNRQRKDQIESKPSRQPPPGALSRRRVALHRSRNQREADKQPDGSRRLAELQSGKRERAVGDELAGGAENHPRNGESQHQSQRQQRVDRTVGHSVLRQQRGDGECHGEECPIARRTTPDPRSVTKLSGDDAPASCCRRRECAAWTRRQQPHHLARTHFPFSMRTMTRARLSMPLWSPALMLNTPLLATTSLEFSSASRSALRNGLLPGWPFFKASGIARCSRMYASHAWPPKVVRLPAPYFAS